MKIIFIALIALVLMMATPTSAYSITMANPDSGYEKDLAVYFPNGTMQGFYNTTSVITLPDDGMSYTFALKPQSNNLIDNPMSWLTNYAFPFVRNNFIAIILIVVAIGYAATRRH